MGCPTKRCTPSASAPLFQHFACTHQFILKYRSLLEGHICPKQRMETVAWGHPQVSGLQVQ
jgi:hypothetical protein